jgi:endonuclease III
MILFINSAYPATDASCAKVFDALKRSVGLRMDDILAAPKGKLTEIIKLGGIFPEQRAARLKEIAALVKHTFAGDLQTVLKKPLPEAKKAPSSSPPLATPVRTRFYCLRRRHQ